MIQKSRTELKDELLNRLSQNWQGLSTGIIGKELISLAVEVLYQANITAESLTRPLDIDTASLAELYRFAAAENIAVTPVTASTITFRWPQTAPVVRTFGIQLTNGPVTFYNISPAVPGQIITLHAGKVVGVGRNIMPAWVESDDSPAIKFVVDSEDATTAAHQQAIIELGSDVVNGSVYVFKQNEGSSVAIAVPFTTFFMEAEGTPGYRLINTRDNKTVIDVSSVTGVADTAASIPMEVIYLKGSSSATAEFKSKVKVTYCSAYNTQFDAQIEVEPISVSQGSKSVENVRRAIRAELALRQVLNNTKAVEQFCENKASINSCKAEFYEEGGKEKCNVYIKPDTIDFSTGEPYAGGRTDLYTTLTANLEYYGYLYGQYTCITASPIKFKVNLIGDLSVEDRNTVLQALSSILSYSNLRIDTQIVSSQLTGQVYQETGVVCQYNFSFSEDADSVRSKGYLAANPTQGTVNLLDVDGNIVASDVDGKFPIKTEEATTLNSAGVVDAINGTLLPIERIYFVDSVGKRTCDLGTSRGKEAYTMIVDPIMDTAISKESIVDSANFSMPPSWMGLSKGLVIDTVAELSTLADKGSFTQYATSSGQLVYVPNGQLRILSKDYFVTALVAVGEKYRYLIWYNGSYRSNLGRPLCSIDSDIKSNYQAASDFSWGTIFAVTGGYIIGSGPNFMEEKVETASVRPPMPVWLDNSYNITVNESGSSVVKHVKDLIPAYAMWQGQLTRYTIFNGKYLYILVGAASGGLCYGRLLLNDVSRFYVDRTNPQWLPSRLITQLFSKESPALPYSYKGKIFAKSDIIGGVTFRGAEIIMMLNGVIARYNEDLVQIGTISNIMLPISTTDLAKPAPFTSLNQCTTGHLRQPKWEFISSSGYRVYLVKVAGYVKKQDAWEAPQVYSGVLTEGSSNISWSKVKFPNDTYAPRIQDDLKEHMKGMSVFVCDCNDNSITLNVINSWQDDSKDDHMGYVRSLVRCSTDSFVSDEIIADFSREDGENKWAGAVKTHKEGFGGLVDYATGQIEIPSEIPGVIDVNYKSSEIVQVTGKSYLYYDE